MKCSCLIVKLCLTALIINYFFITGCSKSPKVEKLENKTLTNLKYAYKAERNSQAKYSAFAKEADEEGYHRLAILYRAMAYSEGIHARNEVEVIKKMGGVPDTSVDIPGIGDVKYNLQVAMKGEPGEREVNYHEFIKQAKVDSIFDALKVFNNSRLSEYQYTNFTNTVVREFDKWKNGTQDFFVCNICGYIVKEITFERCPVCDYPKDQYQKIE
jgi:rubrerythrin